VYDAFDLEIHDDDHPAVTRSDPLASTSTIPRRTLTLTLAATPDPSFRWSSVDDPGTVLACRLLPVSVMR
jgi:hypothetical protein